METQRDQVVEFLMPNGLFASMHCMADENLSRIKARLWKMAREMPLYHRLLEPGRYSFVFINASSEQEEIVDEDLYLGDVRPFGSLFKLAERKGDREEKLQSAKISMLIGKGLFEFTSMEKENVEIREFRKTMADVCARAVKERNETAARRALYRFPPDVEASEELPAHVRANLDQNSTYLFMVYLKQSQRFTFSISVEATPLSLVALTLQKKARTTQNKSREHTDDYVLKVVGRRDYLLAEHPLGMYRYIRWCIAKRKRPQLMLISRDELMTDVPEEEFYMPRRDTGTPSLPPKDMSRMISLMDIKGKVTFKIGKAYGVNIPDKMKIGVRLGLFHGAESLCEVVQTACVTPGQDFNETVIFNLATCDLPRDARLCCVADMVDERKKRRRRRDERVPLAWCNVTMLDSRGQLRMGRMKLGFWPTPEEGFEEDFNPIGTTVSNPNGSAIQLEVFFSEFHHTVIYPEFEKLIEICARQAKLDGTDQTLQGQRLGSSMMMEELGKILSRDSLQELCQQDKELLWSFRWQCRDIMAASLPKVLQSCKYNSSKDVAQMAMLLQVWGDVPSATAIELLHYTYADSSVREAAIRSLKALSDAEFSQYLLQLVQALKYESYLDCGLARLLLEKALKNQKIGHFFFWHLRAEMDNPEIAVRFGLMLEAYCRGCPSHMEELAAQVSVVGKLKELTDVLRTKQDLKDRREINDFMREMLKTRNFLPPCMSPLNPSYSLKSVIFDQCKVFDSKMKPLLISFENSEMPIDAAGETVQLIFKNGDDLRQDMLTLQMLYLMNSLWEQNGLDLKMTVYGCLSTGNSVGFIEVVHAETLAKIHKTKGGARGALDDRALFNWLKSHNDTELKLKDAVRNFTVSCAGYCVATYVLGIGDRHSDNIMVKRTGELLHIDFGHFLGNFKSKFGVRRERVPFVLTNDFLYVITKGIESGGKEEEAERKDHFMDLCVKAYILLRNKADLLISLFMAMLSTGIPELRSMSDISYLTQALALGKSEEEAEQFFRMRLSEAMNNQLSTRINWLLHNFARDN
ncbi:phosphatidylinositol 4,5-bisphosphate 3-kinase catalytic subunit delta isoform-like [Oscarella lobularis]|uniref:phosphatidylinositol 4,5-bisphosphate 3-kinase catalytic subunit delta isoform-like n=1 Tax=Oscarella lobularis TaxID=121494 RepID=UPI0033138868